jgi:hypothetical protein
MTCGAEEGELDEEEEEETLRSKRGVYLLSESRDLRTQYRMIKITTTIKIIPPITAATSNPIGMPDEGAGTCYCFVRK